MCSEQYWLFVVIFLLETLHNRRVIWTQYNRLNSIVNVFDLSDNVRTRACVSSVNQRPIKYPRGSALNNNKQTSDCIVALKTSCYNVCCLSILNVWKSKTLIQCFYVLTRAPDNVLSEYTSQDVTFTILLFSTGVVRQELYRNTTFMAELNRKRITIYDCKIKLNLDSTMRCSTDCQIKHRERQSSS